MAKDIQGVGLGLATRISASRITAITGLRWPLQRLAYHFTKAGFRLAGTLRSKTSAPAETGQRLPASRDNNLFDLSLSEEQEMIRASAQAWARKTIRINAGFSDESCSQPENFHQQVHELGLSHLAIPESLGGAGQNYSPTTSCVIAEALSWGDFSLAFAALAPLAVVNAVSRWGTLQQQEGLLPLWLQDQAFTAAIAVQEQTFQSDPHQLTTRAEKTAAGFRLNGEKTLVPLGGDVSFYLVAAMTEGQPALFIVPAGALGVSFEKCPAMGLRAAATGTLTFKNVQLDHSDRLGGDDFCYQEFTDLGQLHWCALAVGTCQAAIDYLIPYCNERKAFGEPISHRQSVAFMLADMATETEAMRLLLWRAAALAEQGKPFHREACLAHIFSREKAMKIATDAVQLLGGHGFTKEHPAERWYRDLRVLSCINSGLHL